MAKHPHHEIFDDIVKKGDPVISVGRGGGARDPALAYVAQKYYPRNSQLHKQKTSGKEGLALGLGPRAAFTPDKYEKKTLPTPTVKRTSKKGGK